MKRTLVNILSVFFFLCFDDLNALIEPIELPSKLRNCYDLYTAYDTAIDFPPHDIVSTCLQELEIKNKDLSNNTISEDGQRYIRSLLRKVKGQQYETRTKRQSDVRTKTEVRKEIRMLSIYEWNRLVQRLNALKKDTSILPNRYDVIAAIHSGATINGAHGGPAFLPWHRIYLLVLEAALGMTVPYWNSSIDFYMANPALSPLFTSAKLGNGNGLVTTGPFATWGIERDIAGRGSLISRQMISRVLSRTRHSEITEGTSQSNPLYSLEGVHNAVHVWVGGDMTDTERAAYDPIFFMHHAFIDYIWHLFIQQQKANGINPFNDYPKTQRTGHHASDQMAAFGKFKNKDGHLDTYERRTLWDNGYSSLCQYGICISQIKDRLNPFLKFLKPAAALAKDILVLFNAVVKNLNDVVNGAIGKFFVSHFTDSRTREGARNKLKDIISVFGKKKRSVVSLTGRKISSHQQSNDNENNNAFADDSNDALVYIKIKVVFSPYVSRANEPQQATYEHCNNKNKKDSNIWVQANGINYPGKYQKNLIISNKTEHVQAVFIAVKNPNSYATETYLTVHDTCGHVCVPDCSFLGYSFCTGGLKITPDYPLMYQTDNDLDNNVETALIFICDMRANWYQYLIQN